MTPRRLDLNPPGTPVSEQMTGITVTVKQLADALTGLAERHPDYLLAKNRVGNLSIFDEDGEQVGHIALSFAEVDLYEDQADD